MVGKDRIFELAEEVFAKSPTDQTEITVMVDDLWLTRFANNEIHQNVNEADVRVAVRAVLGDRSASVTTSSLAPAAVLACVERACAQARLLPGDPDFAGLPATGEAPSVEAVDPATVAMTPEGRADAAKVIASRAEAKSLNAFGYFSTSTTEIGIANSLGVRAYHAGTEADCLSIVTGPDSSGYARLLSRRGSDVDAGTIADAAIAKCVAGANPRPLPPGDYEVILEEEAVSDLFSSLGMAFDAGAVAEGRSPIGTLVGKKVVGSNITVRDDGHDLSGLPLPFDFEGRPRKRLALVDKGVITDLVYDGKTAARQGKEPTGHAAPAFARGFGFRAVPMHVFVEPGDATLDQMVKSTKKGILVTRFWYNRVVSPMRTLITGMTRDGTFYVENGEIKYPILNMRYTQSVVEALNYVEMVSKKVKLRSMGFGALSVPAMKIGKFSFTGTTEH
ncbi:MAG: TldD/PmbA family protein [Bacillota bacterium]|nr:TldD/PmbA family protein [Bacillota bacterium]